MTTSAALISSQKCLILQYNRWLELYTQIENKVDRISFRMLSNLLEVKERFRQRKLTLNKMLNEMPQNDKILIQLLTEEKEKNKLLSMRNLRLRKIFNLNNKIETQTNLKIISITLIAMSIIMLISNMHVLISMHIFILGLLFVRSVKRLSNKILIEYKKIQKIQKQTRFDFDYKLYANKLFYKKIHAPINSSSLTNTQPTKQLA